ncbi:hypothetical protein JCM8547_006324 [Rhodosporidiobolus lusitaniae]
MDIDQSDQGSQPDSSEPWHTTRAGKRIQELKEVEDNIAALLHFAGCTLASLHPEPLSHFTSRELATDEDDDEGEGGAGKFAGGKGEGEDKVGEFAKYAEGYYVTLNDIQLALRTSIRHLRVSRVSPAPLLDPSFASLSAGSAQPGATSGGVGVGGVALADLLRPLEPGRTRWKGGSKREVAEEEGQAERGGKKSVAALELEKEAWEEVVRTLERGRP